MIEVLVILTI